MNIREAKEKDSKQIAEIYNHYISSTVVTFEEDEITDAEVGSRISAVFRSGLWWIVAHEENEILGYAYASKWHERSAYRNTVEVTVYISASHLYKGIGTALYEELFLRLRSTSIHVAIGCISLPNDSSVKLHEKFGMRKVAHFEEIGYKFGQWIDVGYWQVEFIA